MKHLDIGCGITPKNPYNFDEIYGVDLFPEVSKLGPNFKQANIAVDKIPFNDNFFDSISAFDVLEHIPRQQIDYSTGKIYLPFISLMNEIYRILKPDGLFYALTPAYPGSEVFQDPTHVNFITEETLNYFLEPSSLIRSYGFKGLFEKITMHWDQTATYHLVWEIKAVK
jgi:SAM-dependent methyltransferase